MTDYEFTPDERAGLAYLMATHDEAVEAQWAAFSKLAKDRDAVETWRQVDLAAWSEYVADHQPQRRVNI